MAAEADHQATAQVQKELECCGKKCLGGRGVTGVPHFVINGKFHLSGAQESETLRQIFDKLDQVS